MALSPASPPLPRTSGGLMQALHKRFGLGGGAASSAVGTAGTSATASAPGAPRPADVRVTDPARNVDSEVTPTEYARPVDREPGETDDALVQLVMDRYKDAAQHRRSIEREWVLSCAMEESRQWLRWDDATHRAVSLMKDGETARYITHNLTRPLMSKVVAMATMTKPDANCAPDSDSDLDRDAAAEGRIICAHLAAMHGGTTQTQEIARWAGICGIGWTKHYWDPQGIVDVPRFDPQSGQIIGKQAVRAGEEREDVLSPFEVFLDPLAKRWNDVGWMEHVSVKPLSWFVERFGELGKQISGDTPDAYAGYAQTYLQDGLGSASQVSDFFGSTGKGAQRKAALCLEMWEKPTPRFPEGRLIIVAGRRLLYSGPWPVQVRGQGGRYVFPFSRLVYQEAVGHAYGVGLVKDLAPLQVGLNRLLSRVVERTEQDKLSVAVAQGSKLGADAFEIDEGRNVRKIYYDANEGGPPVFLPAPPIGSDHWRLIDLIWLHMQHIVGIHDVNQGGTPPGVTAGISIELLQQGDRTQLGLFTANIEEYARLRDEIRIAFYAKFASGQLPRLMGMDDSGNPATARRRVMAFRALTGGGSCGVYVVPGSATPKSPAGQQQEVVEWFKAGLFGDPGQDPEASLAAISLMNLSGTDQAREHVIALLKRKLASQPDPAQMEAIKQHGVQVAQQAQLQGQQQSLQLQVQAKQAELQAKQQADAQTLAIKAHIAQETAAQTLQADLTRMLFERHLPPSVTLAGKMDPPAVVDAERLAGIKGEVPPPMPAPGALGAGQRPGGGGGGHAVSQ